MLESMRLQRNRFVHAAKSSREPDQATQAVKAFVDPHLFRLIRNDLDVESIQDYGRCLAISPSINTLCEEKRWRDRAIRVQKKLSENG